MCPRPRTRYGYGRRNLQAQDAESGSNISQWLIIAGASRYVWFTMHQGGDQYKPRRKGMRRKGAVQVHKLCERKRKDKINRKLRALQDLIPNCTHKVDKASVLDEAIEYLKYLQLQIQVIPIIFGGSCVAVPPTQNMMMSGMEAQPFFTSPYGVFGIGSNPQMPPP